MREVPSRSSLHCRSGKPNDGATILRFFTCRTEKGVSPESSPRSSPVHSPGIVETLTEGTMVCSVGGTNEKECILFLLRG